VAAFESGQIVRAAITDCLARADSCGGANAPRRVKGAKQTKPRREGAFFEFTNALYERREFLRLLFAAGRNLQPRKIANARTLGCNNI
jgi:hypothetical protein